MHRPLTLDDLREAEAWAHALYVGVVPPAVGWGSVPGRPLDRYDLEVPALDVALRAGDDQEHPPELID